MPDNHQTLQERYISPDARQTRKGVSLWWVATAFFLGFNVALQVHDYFYKPLIESYKRSLDQCQSLLESHDSKSVISVDEIQKRKRIII